MGHLGGGLWQSDDQGKRGSRWLELVDGVSMLLPLPQLEVLAEDVHPSHGCESCEFISQLLQHLQFCVYDSLDGTRRCGALGHRQAVV